MSERCRHADTVAAYLLAALSEQERHEFEAHLADCTACREDVASLRVVVDALAIAAPQIDPPAQLRGQVMDTVRAEAELLHAAGPGADRPRRTRRRRGWPWGRPFVLAATVLALVLAGLAGFGLRALTSDEGTRTIVRTQVRTVPADVTIPAAPRATAFVVLRGGGVATLRVKGLPSPPKGYVYEVWLVRSGATAPSPTDALFSVDHRGRGRVALPSVRGVTTVLVTAEPDGGSPAPTSNPVISAPL